MLTPWEVLEVAEGASVDEVKAAYRAICLRQHPDRLVGAPESVRAAAHAAMAMANAAYEVLVAASRGFEPEPPSTAIVPRPMPKRTAWDDALAPGPRRGRHADIAA
jgi:hypothetical protein